MATTPLTGSRYPVSSDSANVAQYFANLAFDLDDNTIPRFSTTGARDTAYSSWVTAGGTMADGMRCSVNGVPYRRINGTWRENRQRCITRTVTVGAPANSIATGGASETGVTSGAAALGNFTLYEASTVFVRAIFRAGSSSTAATCIVKIDGSQVGHFGLTRLDVTTEAGGAVALAAGSHSVSLRVDSLGGTASWATARVEIGEFAAE